MSQQGVNSFQRLPLSYTSLEAIEHVLESHLAEGKSGGVIQYSFENLAILSSMYGSEVVEHALGDLFDQIKSQLNEQETLHRIARDCYLIILLGLEPDALIDMGVKFHTMIQAHENNAKQPMFFVESSASVAFPLHAHTASEILNKASLALACRKIYPYTGYYYDHTMLKAHHAMHCSYVKMAAKLHGCITHNTLHAAYQPIVDYKKKEVLFFELLLRIPSTDGTSLSIGPFISAAESLGLIDKVDLYALNLAINTLKEHPTLFLSINISSYNIENERFIQQVEQLLQDRSIARNLIIEITETGGKKDLSKAINFIKRMHTLGTKVALDDFGSGYTSFKQISTLPVDFIKIDGSFISNIVENKDSKLLVKTLLMLSEEYGCLVIAEYVENHAIVSTLNNLNVTYMQGNFFYPAKEDALHYTYTSADSLQKNATLTTTTTKSSLS